MKKPAKFEPSFEYIAMPSRSWEDYAGACLIVSLGVIMGLSVALWVAG